MAQKAWRRPIGSGSRGAKGIGLDWENLLTPASSEPEGAEPRELETLDLDVAGSSWRPRGQTPRARGDLDRRVARETSAAESSASTAGPGARELRAQAKRRKAKRASKTLTWKEMFVVIGPLAGKGSVEALRRAVSRAKRGTILYPIRGHGRQAGIVGEVRRALSRDARALAQGNESRVRG